MTATMVAGDLAGHHPAGRWVDVGLDVATSVIDQLLDRPPACDLEQTEASAGKLVAETAILLHALRGDAARRPRIEELARRLLPHATNGAVRIGVAMQPALALDYAAGYLALRTFGSDPALDALLHAAIADRTAAGRERVPHRALEQHWLRSLLDDGAATAGDAAAIEATVLGAELDILHGTRDDGYAFTHALMYATDFGGTVCDIPSADSLAAQAASATARFLDDDDFDLVGELLFTCPLLGLPLDPVAHAAYAVLNRAASTVGLLPSAAMSGAAIAAQAPDARASYTIAVSYHSAYVMALAEHLTGGSARHAPADTAVAAHFDALIGADTGRVPEWRRLPGGPAAMPLEFLVDVALIRAVRRTDLATARTVLVDALDAGIATTTAMHQATRLLRRAARLTGG